MKKKLEHIWYYYKWYIFTALLVICVAVDFFGDIRQNQEPDARVSIVTVTPVSEETMDVLRTFFENACGDRNGDGTCLVEVNLYAYDGNADSGEDPDAYAAAAVHLASEVRAGETELFLSDAEELMAQADSLKRWGKWQDYNGLGALDCPELEEFYIYGFPEKQEAVEKILG